MSKASQALLTFFWVAFAAFLLASIPHVAWFFSIYEPVDGPGGGLYWIVSYGIAISIDITTFLLSMTVAKMMQQGKSKGLIFTVWLFILGLAGLSWFMNYKYAVHFQNAGQIEISPLTISLFGLVSWQIPDMNPIIASCFQVLAVAYTWIADKIAAGEKVKTSAELQAEADEMEKLAVQKARIAATKRANVEGGIDGAIGLVGVLGRRVRQEFSKPKKGEENNEETTVVLPGQPLEDKLQKTLDFFAENGTEISDEKLAEHLHLTRPASARFWRLKAMEILRVNPEFEVRKTSPSTGPLSQEIEEETTEETDTLPDRKADVSSQETDKMPVLDPELIPLVARYPNAARLLSMSGTTVHLQEVSNAFDCTMRLLKNRVAEKKIKKTRSEEIVYKDSVIEWAKQELLPKGKGKVINLESARNPQVKTEEQRGEKVSG